jgi:hypothetical protein
VSGPRLIGRYLEVLAAQLPASIVEELADGLDETYRSCLRQGLAPEAAAARAVAEFGPPEAIVADFARVNPGRRAARRLLGFGPVVGGCWLAALLTSRARPGSVLAWPGPAWPGSALVFGVVLSVCIGLALVAALGRRYRVACLTGAAGCAGFAALDTVLVMGVLVAGAPVTWVTGVAVAASCARIALCARALPPALAR